MSFNPLLSNVSILYSLKTRENHWLSGVFRGYIMEKEIRNWLNGIWSVQTGLDPKHNGKRNRVKAKICNLLARRKTQIRKYISVRNIFPNIWQTTYQDMLQHRKWFNSKYGVFDFQCKWLMHENRAEWDNSKF